MIKITTTEQLAGVRLVGDYEDLYQLVDAIHEIVVDEYSEKYEKYSRYAAASLRVLGVCYDIRHAYQGDRDVVTESNGIMSTGYRYGGNGGNFLKCLVFSMVLDDEVYD